ncbi:MAG TPA: carboxypeptidase-like regulatory domain-containing protein [Thermoanaerobaculia bacterium]|nr:carboxypeptidase-like regulatory domain-containing protein [Thermoanaerobaculia bacterium]
MRRLRAIAIASAIVILAVPAQSEVPLPAFLQVLGNVTSSARPVGNALVIALNLNSLEAIQTFSGSDGSFSLPQLPAGVYKIIAMKYGFTPAIETIVPTKKEHRVKFRLETEKQSHDTNQRMWEIRGSLPPDILRDIDMVMTPPPDPIGVSATEAYAAPRFKGDLMSMTGMTSSATTSTSGPAFAQTALGLQSRLGENWQLGFRGNLHRVEDPNQNETFGTPVAEASTAQIELRSSPTDSYRLASARSWWRYRDDLPDDAHQADIRSNNFEWQHGDSRVQVRYLEQQNIFLATPGSDLIEIAGGTTVIQTARNDVGVSLRVTQESIRNTPGTVTAPTLRTADLTTNAKFVVAPAFTFDYGMSSRVGLYGTEWAPRSGAELKIGKDTTLVVSGMYKLVDVTQQNTLPSVVVWSDDSHLLPHYSYSAGIVSGDTSAEHFSVIGSVSATDTPLRIVFTDGLEHFWDGLYIDAGDVRRDIRVSFRKELGSRVLLDVSSMAGTAAPAHAVVTHGSEKIYLAGDVESTYSPTRTTLAVSYRQIQQPQPAGGDPYRTQRVDVRVAQSLHLPLDLKVLLGIELARSENSRILLDALDADGSTRRYIGGLAVNF